MTAQPDNWEYYEALLRDHFQQSQPAAQPWDEVISAALAVTDLTEAFAGDPARDMDSHDPPLDAFPDQHAADGTTSQEADDHAGPSGPSFFSDHPEDEEEPEDGETDGHEDTSGPESQPFDDLFGVPPTDT